MPVDTNELKYTFVVTANRCKKVESSSIIDRDEVEQEIEFDFDLDKLKLANNRIGRP